MKKFNILSYIIQLIIFTLIFTIMFIEHNIIKWILIEIFSLAFIGYFINYKSKNKLRRLIYFYISSFSRLFLFWLLLIYYDLWIWELWNKYDFDKYYTKKIIQYTILLKLGVYPFQFWIPWIFNFIEWNIIFIFSTINKLIPIFILTTISSYDDPIFIYFLLLNSLFSVISCIDEQNYKKILAYSSINHTTFLILLSYLNTYISIYYFYLYTINSYIFIKLIQKINITTKSEIILTYNSNSNIIKFLFIIFTLSYRILPPLIFFIIKWIFFYELNLSNSTNFFLISIIILRVIITYNYLDIIKFTIFHKKLVKKYILLNKYIIKNKFKYKILLFLINIFIFCIFFY